MAVMVDSGIFIAAYLKRDKLHTKGERLLGEAFRERIMITDHILDEILTFLKARGGLKLGKRVMRVIANSPYIQLACSNETELEEALKIYSKTDKLSFCDALTVAMMQARKIKKLYSFDKDFDQFKHVRRGG